VAQAGSGHCYANARVRRSSRARAPRQASQGQRDPCRFRGEGLRTIRNQLHVNRTRGSARQGHDGRNPMKTHTKRRTTGLLAATAASALLLAACNGNGNGTEDDDAAAPAEEGDVEEEEANGGADAGPVILGI